ncbi:hypothetical protein GH714_019662 [Hevea brasiliensis]|uniref:Uncharacterized protein n=1 Tax=Hevea brasiliensis TaxID=3981 RepID=A0A6A6LB23_HEVBR|nr:hypothetical protein GH714_019662 [Hevea brasiliensis]
MNEEGWFNKYSGHEVSFDFCFKGLPELIHMLHCNIKKCGVRLLYVEAKTKSSRMFDSDNEEEESNSKRIKYSDDQEVVGIGDVSLDTGNRMKLMLKDVRQALDVLLNLISARRLDDEGYLISSGENHVLLWYDPYSEASQTGLMNEEGWFNKSSGHKVSFDFCFKGLAELIHMLHCNIKKCGVRLLYVEAKTKPSRMFEFDPDNEKEESNSKRIKYSNYQDVSYQV